MLVFIGWFFLNSNAQGQVDPRWLNSWNEANEMIPSKISSVSRIAPEDEPGKPLIIQGKIFNPDGTPAKNVLVHAYHRDARGYDFGKNDRELSTWRLQGWAKTDENGSFEFKTIRPAADHISREGPHIHFTTLSAHYGRQWAPKVFFDDDPLLTASQRMRSQEAGEYGWIAEVEVKDGVQYITVNIKLKESGDF
ncbi:MAG: hypothetical protein AAFX87_27135 [Bacteroidota bacterium]